MCADDRGTTKLSINQPNSPSSEGLLGLIPGAMSLRVYLRKSLNPTGFELYVSNICKHSESPKSHTNK